MENKLDCAIVRDLLPSCADGLTSDVTNEAIEAHIKDCPDCAQALRLMKEPQKGADAPVAEVDYLKMVRRRGARRSLILGVALMLLGLALFGFRVFYVGYPADAADAVFDVSVDGNDVSLRVRPVSSGLSICRVTFSDSNGIVSVKVYTAPKTFFNQGDAAASYTAVSPVGQIRAGDAILWEEGVAIRPLTAQLFARINPFVGDMPSNAQIADILGVADQLGPYTNELQTAAEPYSWTLRLEAKIAQDEESAARDIMTADAYVMLATVGNLGSVNWEYQTDAGARSYTVTTQDASAHMGGDIKAYARSASALQTLLESLSIKWAGVMQTPQQEGAFCLNVRNYSDSEICGIAIDYYLGDKLLGSAATQNADGSALERGGEFTFIFTPDDFPADASPARLSSFSFDLFVTDAQGVNIAVGERMPLSAAYGRSALCFLTGDYGAGFTLRVS